MKALLLIALLITPAVHANNPSERDIQILRDIAHFVEGLSDEENEPSERDIQVLRGIVHFVKSLSDEELDRLTDEERLRQLFIIDQAVQLDEAIGRMQPESKPDERMISYEPLS